MKYLGRWWGPRDKQPVLTMHGWLENSNSWDPFLNMVPEDEPISFLSFDMPGNGHSSHYYQNSWYHASDDMIPLRLLFKHFQFKEPVTFLCHSYSTGHAYLYTSAFPKVRIFQDYMLMEKNYSSGLILTVLRNPFFS